MIPIFSRLGIDIYGRAHEERIGVRLTGLPAGESINMPELMRFLRRRKPGGALSSKRQESDAPVFVSGLSEEGVLLKSELHAYIENTDIRSSDYAALRDIPRPSHADYTAYVKWQGKEDMRGGGRFSGRMTAPMAIAGGIALQILARRGIYIGSHIKSIADIADAPLPLQPSKELLASLSEMPLPTLSKKAALRMEKRILEAQAAGDSVGGVCECVGIGVPAGLGGEMFRGIEGRLALTLFGIPAVKGVEFGAGFSGAKMRGSEHNDPFIIEDGRIKTSQNNSGGIQGGISNGMPIVVSVAIKPTPSIAAEQKSVSISTGEPRTLNIIGRHDPVIALRALPVIEGLTALVLLDILLEEDKL